jgi:amino-acid N-acetyltransferase
MSKIKFTISAATQDDLALVIQFLQPFVDRKQLLQRTSLDLQLLLRHGFKAVLEDPQVAAIHPIVGFCALEIYSKKLAEIQCLAVAEDFQRQGIGKSMVERCVARAKEEKVLELLAISNSEAMFQACGFDYSLPNQKRAFFFQTQPDVEQQ